MLEDVGRKKSRKPRNRMPNYEFLRKLKFTSIRQLQIKQASAPTGRANPILKESPTAMAATDIFFNPDARKRVLPGAF